MSNTEHEFADTNRHLVEVPDSFAVARWPRDADIATIARCILGTLKYEPHTADTTVLRRALEHIAEQTNGAATMTKPEQAVMPAFAFGRRHDIELEAGYILAGQLVVDLPSGTELTEEQQQTIGSIIQRLTAMAQSGEMPTDALITGWPGGGERPANAVDTSNDEVMLAWANKRLVIGVRVDPRDDGMVRIDSDMMRQMDLPDAPPGQRKRR